MCTKGSLCEQERRGRQTRPKTKKETQGGRSSGRGGKKRGGVEKLVVSGILVASYSWRPKEEGLSRVPLPLSLALCLHGATSDSCLLVEGEGGQYQGKGGTNSFMVRDDVDEEKQVL